jgi:hypothetical protein
MEVDVDLIIRWLAMELMGLGVEEEFNYIEDQPQIIMFG